MPSCIYIEYMPALLARSSRVAAVPSCIGKDLYAPSDL